MEGKENYKQFMPIGTKINAQELVNSSVSLRLRDKPMSNNGRIVKQKYRYICVYSVGGKLMDVIENINRYLEEDQPNLLKKFIINACNPNYAGRTCGGFMWTRHEVAADIKEKIEPLIFESYVGRFYRYTDTGMYLECLNGKISLRKWCVQEGFDHNEVIPALLEHDRKPFKMFGEHWMVLNNGNGDE